MSSTIAPPTSDLAEEIEKLKSDLAVAEAARVRPEDVRANAIRRQLFEKEAELRQQQEFESAAAAEQQRQQQLALLAETGKEIDRLKSETVALRRMIAELPARLATGEYELNRLLRRHALLKSEVGV
jgi:hypothetical protein